jgi:hypothetical protein
VWDFADENERRISVEELVEGIQVFPDHFEVKVNGPPPLNLLIGEVGLKLPEIVGVSYFLIRNRPEVRQSLERSQVSDFTSSSRRYKRSIARKLSSSGLRTTP